MLSFRISEVRQKRPSTEKGLGRELIGSGTALTHCVPSKETLPCSVPSRWMAGPGDNTEFHFT